MEVVGRGRSVCVKYRLRDGCEKDNFTFHALNDAIGIQLLTRFLMGHFDVLLSKVIQ